MARLGSEHGSQKMKKRVRKPFTHRVVDTATVGGSEETRQISTENGASVYTLESKEKSWYGNDFFIRSVPYDCPGAHGLFSARDKTGGIVYT